MGRQPVAISFQDNEVYECGATLVALLAYPADDKDEIRRAHIHASLCRHALEFQHLSNPDDWRPKPVKLPYVFRDAKLAKRDVIFAAKRLGERLIAARMVIPFLQRAEPG